MCFICVLVNESMFKNRDKNAQEISFDDTMVFRFQLCNLVGLNKCSQNKLNRNIRCFQLELSVLYHSDVFHCTRLVNFPLVITYIFGLVQIFKFLPKETHMLSFLLGCL